MHDRWLSLVVMIIVLAAAIGFSMQAVRAERESEMASHAFEPSTGPDDDG